MYQHLDQRLVTHGTPLRPVSGVGWWQRDDVLELQEISGDAAGKSFTGLCRWTMSNGCVYEGKLVDGTRQGPGRFEFDSRDVYEGEWANDLFEGTGV
jgi:hypothetical protein